MEEQMPYVPVEVRIPPGTPLLTRLRIAWATARFSARLSRASEAERERIFAYLEAQPGVTVTRTERER
jgi:hypothetical protein